MKNQVKEIGLAALLLLAIVAFILVIVFANAPLCYALNHWNNYWSDK